MLAALHAKGIYHRDIKPQNILVETKSVHGINEIVNSGVTDFGLAIYTSTDDLIGESKCGTPGYMAPESLAYNHYCQ